MRLKQPNCCKVHHNVVNKCKLNYQNHSATCNNNVFVGLAVVVRRHRPRPYRSHIICHTVPQNAGCHRKPAKTGCSHTVCRDIHIQREPRLQSASTCQERATSVMQMPHSICHQHQFIFHQAHLVQYRVTYVVIATKPEATMLTS